MKKSFFNITALAGVVLPSLVSAEGKAATQSQNMGEPFNIMILLAIVWLMVTVSLIYLGKQQKSKEEEKGQKEGWVLEIAWTAAPLLMVLLLGVGV
ncbi:MAG: hypothetical protein HGA78_11180 [Nitrospirales bacterium]|nr:hypothetical protein [Nitrospirales bacterium]